MLAVSNYHVTGIVPACRIIYFLKYFLYINYSDLCPKKLIYWTVIKYSSLSSCANHFEAVAASK